MKVSAKYLTMATIAIPPRSCLFHRKKRTKDLLEYLNINTNGSLTQIVNGNPTAERLENIADFFGVSIDTFFERNSNYAGVATPATPNVVATLQISKLETIIKEKDKRIVLLEDMVEVLKRIKNKGLSRTCHGR